MHLNVFCCPACKEPLSETAGGLSCTSCEGRYEIKNGIPDLFTSSPEYPDDRNLVYIQPEMAEAKDTVFRLGARSLKGMAFCMEEIGRRTFSGCRVLEVAMGAGHFTRWIAEVSHPDAEIYAFDFSWPMIEKAKANTQNAPNITLFRANSRGTLPFKKETFDIILVRLAPFKPYDIPDACFSLLRPGGSYFNASTTAGERFDIPPTQWATDLGFESADYHIWRYSRAHSEEAYLAGLIDGPRRPYEVVNLEKARALTADMKRLHGTPDGILTPHVEALLIAHKGD